MSGLKPFFITGASAKIKLNGKTLAFCTDLSYSIQIITQTPKVLGMYEGSSVEPLGYSVSGSFTVIRYAKGIQGAAGHPSGTASNDAGNGVGNWDTAWGGGLYNNTQSILGMGNSGRANEALNPSTFNQGTTFDIQVYQKISPQQTKEQLSMLSAADYLSGASSGSFVTDYLSGETTSGSGEGGKMIGVANIRNCRITQADFQISKKSLAIQRFNFVALYVDEDSMVADFSGTGQQF